MSHFNFCIKKLHLHCVFIWIFVPKNRHHNVVEWDSLMDFQTLCEYCWLRKSPSIKRSLISSKPRRLFLAVFRKFLGVFVQSKIRSADLSSVIVFRSACPINSVGCLFPAACPIIYALLCNPKSILSNELASKPRHGGGKALWYDAFLLEV